MLCPLQFPWRPKELQNQQQQQQQFWKLCSCKSWNLLSQRKSRDKHYLDTAETVQLEKLGLVGVAGVKTTLRPNIVTQWYKLKGSYNASSTGFIMFRLFNWCPRWCFIIVREQYINPPEPIFGSLKFSLGQVPCFRMPYSASHTAGYATEKTEYWLYD